ncbi:MAG: hypothetical protein J4F37_00585 [Acidobacteria bacterium]|nr:hypothetical protein [Acidobacteriota bacterium]
MIRAALRIAAAVLMPAAVAQAGGQDSRVEAAEVRCPAVLGVGVATDVVFCDVAIRNEAGRGILVVIPARRGEATVSFTLHNRHTYSESETRAGRAYTEYTAEVAVAALDGRVLGRRYILSEFRSAGDLVDRVTGGAGPDGLKAVVPTGRERVFVTVPEDIDTIAIVGQSLEVVRVDGRETFRTPGRPVAVISEVEVEYRAP